MWAIFPTNKHTKAVIELMMATLLPHKASERLVAIVGGSLLEDAVETTLRERLLNNKGLIDSLLDFDKPLGSVGPQIHLLHLLGDHVTVVKELKQPAGNADELADKLYKAIEHRVPKAAAARDFLQRLAEISAQHNKPLYWRTPTGLPVLSLYLEPDIISNPSRFT